MIQAMDISPEASISVKHKDLLALCVITLEAHLGVKITLVKGGPSISDPAGEIENYIGFRDKSGHAIAIGIDYGKNLRLINGRSA